MPYTADNVPSYVPKSKRKQWAAIFNSCAESGKKEEDCFRMASGAIKEKDDKGYIYDTWDVESRQMDQQSAGYSSVGGMGGTTACANCNWFVPSRDACVLVSGDIVATGLSNLYMAKPEYIQQPIPVTIVAGGESVKVKSTAQQLPVVGKLFGDGEELDSPITLFRAKDNSLRFFCHPSNCFRDREKEILTAAAHKEYVEWVTNNPGYYPELQIWHTPAAKVGKVDWIDYADDFLCAAGVIHKDYEDQVIKAVQLGAGMSHGFIPVHDVKDVRDVIKYRSFELTILPVARACNVYTDFNVLTKEWSEQEMAFTAEKRKYFTELGFSEEDISRFEKSTKDMSDKIKASGVDFKDTSETDEAHSLVPQLVALTEAVTAMSGTLATVVTAQQEQAKELAATKEVATKSLDEAVAEQYKAKVSGMPQGFVASQSQSNVDAEASAKLKEAGNEDNVFFDMIRQQALGGYGFVDPGKALAGAGSGVPTPINNENGSAQ